MSNTENYKIAYNQAKADLAEIEPRHQALLDAVKSLEKLLSLENGNGFSDGDKEQEEINIPSGSFEGLTVKEATLKCLYLADRALMTREIADSIEKAGYPHNSVNFWNTVNTTLGRLEEKEGWVEKKGKGWELNAFGRAAVMETPNLFNQS